MQFIYARRVFQFLFGKETAAVIDGKLQKRIQLNSIWSYMVTS